MVFVFSQGSTARLQIGSYPSPDTDSPFAQDMVYSHNCTER